MICEPDLAMAESISQFLTKHKLPEALAMFNEHWSRYVAHSTEQPTEEQEGNGDAAVAQDAAPQAAPIEPASSAPTVPATPPSSAKGRAHSTDATPSETGREKQVPHSPTTIISSSKKYGVVSIVGDESDLWDCDELADLAPRYPRGGGLPQSVFDSTRREATEYAAYHPYQKTGPSPSLPLESFDLRIIYESGKTGFEEAKEFPILVNSVIAGRYQVLQFLDSAAFSRAVKCLDLKHGHEVCIKIIRNSKDFFDQAMDEIKLLQFINCGGNPEENCVLQLFDYFYYKEHVFIVTELLRDNLYEFGKFNREQETEPYFTLPRIQSIARQVLTALAFLHKLDLLHCDLKPENILIKSYSRCEVKVIDFGSSCYITDNLSSYIQSRCYRAPEVVLGCHYNGGIDIWSLGAILPELMTGQVLFHNETVAGMLARIGGVCGPYPERMLHEGRHTCRFVTQHGAFYELNKETGQLMFHFPNVAPLRSTNLGSTDELYIDFITRCLTLDHKFRPSAVELLSHPFLQKDFGNVFSSPPALKAAH